MPVATKPSLTLRRQLKATPKRVFEAWTRPQDLKRWFGPSDAMEVTEASVDLKVGGRYRLVLREPGGEMHRVSGAYREIVPHSRLVFTWAWESMPDRQSLVTVTIEAKDGGCALQLHHEQFADDSARDKHQHGWTGSLERLERHLG